MMDGVMGLLVIKHTLRQALIKFLLLATSHISQGWLLKVKSKNINRQ